MRRRYSRRGFLRFSAAGVITTIMGVKGSRFCGASLTEAPIKEDTAEGLTAYQDGPQIWVRWENHVLTSYRAHPSQKYPYFYPVSGPVTGLSLTTETSLPWPHHRSLLFGCDRVNGANYWQGPVNAGQIVSQEPTLGTVAPEAVEILDTCIWAVPGQPPVMRDTRRFVVRITEAGMWFLDAEITWHAEQDVTIEKTNHSLFALRAAPDIAPNGGGFLRNAEGQEGEKATFGQPSAWCAFWGPRRGQGPVEGIALFDHPKNPWAPTPWFTRDYGFISPTPFQFQTQPWRLPKGQSVTLRYRVIAFAGTPDEAQLAEQYAAWTRED